MGEEDFLDDFEKEFEKVDSFSELPDLIERKINIEEVKEEIRPVVEDELSGMISNRNKVRDLDYIVNEVLNNILSVLGSDNKRLEDFFREHGLDEKQSQKAIEEILNWFFVLSLFSDMGKKYSDEYMTNKFEIILSNAYEKDEEAFIEVMKNPIESREFITGFQNAFANTDISEDIDKEDKNKMLQVIQNTYEFGLEDSMLLITKLLSINQGKSLDVSNAGHIKDRISSSNYPELWNDEFRKVRHSATHNRYSINDDYVEMWDREGDWERTYSDEELQELMAEVTKRMRYILYSLAVAVDRIDIKDRTEDELVKFTASMKKLVANH